MFTGQFQPSGFSYTHTYGAAEAQGSAYWEAQRKRWYDLMWATTIGDPQRREYEKLANNARINRDAAAKVEQMSEGPAPATVSDEDAAASLTFSEGGGVVRIDTAGAKAAEVVRAPPRRTSRGRSTSRGRKDEGFSNTQIALGIFGVVSLLAVVGIVAQRRSSGE